jgi:hypothetical protein
MRQSGHGAVGFLFAGLSLAALVLMGTAAPAQTSGPAMADQPTLVPGDTWTVRYSDGTRATRKFLREDAGVLVFEVSQTSQRGGAARGQLHLTRDLSTVRMLDAGGAELQRFDPHSLGLQFPLSVGKEWQGTCERFDEGRTAGTFAGTYKVVGIESVTVPAGMFQAFRLEGQTYEVQAPGKRWRFIHWYAPAVRNEAKLAAMDPDGNVTEVELVEFRPAGRVPPSAHKTRKGAEAFLGVWEGHWKENVLATRLTVERIEGDTVIAVYWRGAYIFPGLQRPSQQRVEGKFLDAKTLRFEVWDDANQRWAEATYTMNRDRTLSAKWRSGGVAATGILKKEP